MILTDFPKLCLSFDKLISYPYANTVSEVSRFLLDDGSSTNTMNMFLYLASRISTSDVNSCVSFRIYKEYKTLIRWEENTTTKTVSYTCIFKNLQQIVDVTKMKNKIYHSFSSKI